MLNHPTLQKLRAFRLTGIADALQEQLENPLTDLDFESRIGLLVEREFCLRDNRKIKKRLTQARLKQAAFAQDKNLKFEAK